ncbi:MAG: BlaI/MecI/CopY family transcriptional regulator [Endomicrobia bacterium]|nr:BlaI/MecI/CopY family transcriptional regulator [Endomicrobiia bacterium]
MTSEIYKYLNKFLKNKKLINLKEAKKKYQEKEIDEDTFNLYMIINLLAKNKQKRKRMKTEEIIEIIKSFNRPVEAKEIKEKIDEKYEKNMQITNVYILLKKLVNKNFLKFEQIGRKKLYYVGE